jgi:NAD dependent epimerase/dehydratase family enzyme
MTGPFRFFVGGKVGSGKQWFSWVHIDDAVAAYLAALDDDRYRGPVNLVAPDAARASDVAKAIGAALGRPSWLPVPGFAVRAAAGEVAEYLLHGRKAIPRVLEKNGFKFSHPTLREAVADALKSGQSAA